MTELEVLFLLDEPPNGWERKALDEWILASPWGRKPGTWTLWALSYGDIPEGFLKAKAVVTVGSKATRFVMANATLPKRIKSVKLQNRAYKVTEISGFGEAKFLLVLKSEGQIRMASRFAEQAGYPVRPAGTRKTIEALWALATHLSAQPLTPP